MGKLAFVCCLGYKRARCYDMEDEKEVDFLSKEVGAGSGPAPFFMLVVYLFEAGETLVPTDVSFVTVPLEKETL